MTLYKRGHPQYPKYTNTDFDEGDVVRLAAGTGIQSLNKVHEYTIHNITYSSTNETEYMDGVYQTVYNQKLTVKDPYGSYSEREFLARNFVLVRKKGTAAVNQPQLDNNIPTLTREVTSKLNESNELVETYGEIMEHESVLKAKAWCQAQITESIRKDNVYRKFEIFRRTSIAQAKEPEIEFV